MTDTRQSIDAELRRAERKMLIDRVKSMPLQDLIGRHTHLRPAGRAKFKGLCPFHGERTPSFVVDEKFGNFKCFGCGAGNDGGSIIDFVMMQDSLDFNQALDYCAKFYGLMHDPDNLRRKPTAPVKRMTQQHALAAEAREMERARQIFADGVCADRTLVDAYLRDTRKIRIDKLPGGIIPPSIRYAPAIEYWNAGKVIGTFPAMLTGLQNVNRHITGVHITYLSIFTRDKIRIPDPACEGKNLPAKKMRGKAWASGMRFAPVSEHLLVAEGLENALTVMAETGTPAWAAGSLDNLAGHGQGKGAPHPRRIDKTLPSVYPDMEQENFLLPREVKRVTILKDNDSKDPEAAACLFERAGRRFAQGGRIVLFAEPPRGMDFNDVVMQAAKAAEVVG